MSKLNPWLKNIGLVLGITSTAFFGFDYFVFSKLQPKMIRFEAISSAEESLMNDVGIGLLLFLALCLLTLFRMAGYLKNAKKITFPFILLVASGVIALLLVFSDVALLNDIGKQYKYGLSQPEWSLLYPLMGFQFVMAAVFTCLHLFGFKEENQVAHVVRDSNIFLMVQYVGIICGLMGLASSSMGFLFPKSWTLLVHTTLSSLILLMPYALAVGYWLITKFQEEHRQWYDEKQRQDVGRSAFLTLLLSVVFMTGVFIANYNNLEGVVRILWLPLYLFWILLSFSASNLYFSARE